MQSCKKCESKREKLTLDGKAENKTKVVLNI